MNYNYRNNLTLKIIIPLIFVANKLLIRQGERLNTYSMGKQNEKQIKLFFP